MGTIRPETSVNDYQSTLRNIPEERRSHLKIFYFIFQNSNVLVISRFQWLILAEGEIT
jgi:hypothetical protein